MKKHFSTLTLAAVLFMASGAARADLEFPSPSPSGKIIQKVGVTNITIDYSRPGLKGRKVFGEQVPYGQVWRTGANASTKISFSGDVSIGGKVVPAGIYSLVSIPGAQSWTIILNKELDLSNTVKYDPAKDVTRVEVKPITLEKPLETLTFEVADIHDESANLVLSWGNVAVHVPIHLDTVARMMANIQTEMAKSPEQSPRTYAESAGFYLEHDGDLDQALTWMDKALTAQPEAFYWVHRKALILAKLGRKEQAIAEAKRCMSLVKNNPSFRDEYIWKSQKLIDSLQ